MQTFSTWANEYTKHVRPQVGVVVRACAFRPPGVQGKEDARMGTCGMGCKGVVQGQVQGWVQGGGAKGMQER